MERNNLSGQQDSIASATSHLTHSHTRQDAPQCQTNTTIQIDHDHEAAVANSPSCTSTHSHPPIWDQNTSSDPEAKEPSSTEAPEASRTKLETFLVVFALCLALFLAALDVTIITTAVPTISAHFNSSLGYVWVGSSYLLGNAAFVTVWGRISDIWGRKPVLLCAIAIFWLGSLLCGVSNSMGMLIASRALQGIGGGGTIVLPNICVSDLFSMRSRGMYFGILAMVWALASAVGPVLGGVFTSRVSWRWCFYINLPICGVGMIILHFVLKLHNPRTPIREGLAAIDWSGTVLIIGGTVMFLFGLEFGGVTYPWTSSTVICLLVFGVLTLGLFVINEFKYAKFPVTPLRLFNSRNGVTAYALSFCHALTFMGGSYWLPLYFQGVLRADSLKSGLYLLPFVVSLSVTSAVVGIAIKKTGNYKLPIIAGLVVNVLGYGLFIDLGPELNWAKMISFQIIAGIGIGPNFQAPLIALQTNVEPRDIGAATSCYSFLRQIGTSASVVLGGVIFNNRMQSQQAYLRRELGSELAERLSGMNAAGNVQLVAALEGHEGQVARGAYWNAMQTMFVAYTCFASLGLIISFFTKQVALSKNHKDFKTGLNVVQEGSDESVQDERRKREEEEKIAKIPSYTV